MSTAMQMWERPKADNRLIPRYRSEIVESHSHERINNFFLSSVVPSSIHFDQISRSLEKENFVDTLPNKPSFSTSMHNGIGDSFSVQTKEIIVKDKNKTTRKTSKKSRVKSGRKRRSKTSVKRSKQAIKHSEKQNPMKGKNNEISDEQVRALVVKSTQLSACPRLPAASPTSIKPKVDISPYSQNLLVKLPNAVPKQYKSLPRAIVEKNLPNGNLPFVSNDKLPVYPVNKKNGNQQFSVSMPGSLPLSLKAVYASDDVTKTSSRKFLYGEGFVNKQLLEAKGMDQALKTNSLKDRLNLIHCYGNDYLTITRNYESQKKKERLVKQHQNRLAEKEESDKKKQFQRKKIYALNRLMTELEHKKFEDFMKNLTSSR